MKLTLAALAALFLLTSGATAQRYEEDRRGEPGVERDVVRVPLPLPGYTDRQRYREDRRRARRAYRYRRYHRYEETW